MRTEVLVALVETPRTGKPCGAPTPLGPCLINGFEPCGRCHEDGAIAAQGIMGRLLSVNFAELAGDLTWSGFQLSAPA